MSDKTSRFQPVDARTVTGSAVTDADLPVYSGINTVVKGTADQLFEKFYIQALTALAVGKQ